MARPRVLDEEKLELIRRMVAAGMSLTRTAEHVGCDVKTIWRHRRQHPEFDAELRRARVAADAEPLETVRRAAATNWRAAVWLLDRQARLQKQQERARKQGATSRKQAGPRQRARQQRDRQLQDLRPLAVAVERWVAEWNRRNDERRIDSVEVLVQLAGGAENNAASCSPPREQTSRKNKG